MANWVTLANGVHIDLDDPTNPITGSGSFSDLGKGGSSKNLSGSKSASAVSKKNMVTVSGYNVDLNDPHNPITGDGDFSSYFNGGKQVTSRKDIQKSSYMGVLKGMSQSEMMDYIKGQEFTLKEEGHYMSDSEKKEYKERIAMMRKIYDSKVKNHKK